MSAEPISCACCGRQIRYEHGRWRHMDGMGICMTLTHRRDLDLRDRRARPAEPAGGGDQ